MKPTTIITHTRSEKMRTSVLIAAIAKRLAGIGQDDEERKVFERWARERHMDPSYSRGVPSQYANHDTFLAFEAFALGLMVGGKEPVPD